MTNPLITIEVTLTPNDGKPSGYQFVYASDSGLVTPDGNIDLSYFDHEFVDLVFVLMPVDAIYPTFPPKGRDAVWFSKWRKHEPPPPPCPTSSGQVGSSFKKFSFPSPHELRFTDHNNDNLRYVYALRCIVMPGEPLVVDDPVIINKIGSGSV